MTDDRSREVWIHLEAMRGRIDSLERWKEAVEAVDLYRNKNRLSSREEDYQKRDLAMTKRQVNVAVAAIVFSSLLSAVGIMLVLLHA